MGTGQFLATPDWLNSAFVILLLFIVVNILTANFFRLKSEIQTFWSFNKVYFLPIGILIGGLIARSEERRVGKECRCRWRSDHYKKIRIASRQTGYQPQDAGSYTR